MRAFFSGHTRIIARYICTWLIFKNFAIICDKLYRYITITYAENLVNFKEYFLKSTIQWFDEISISAISSENKFRENYPVYLVRNVVLCSKHFIDSVCSKVYKYIRSILSGPRGIKEIFKQEMAPPLGAGGAASTSDRRAPPIKKFFSRNNIEC